MTPATSADTKTTTQSSVVRPCFNPHEEGNAGQSEWVTPAAHPSLPAVTSTDESVLEFIGLGGQSTEAVAERFPDFDMERLVRAHLVVVWLSGAETEAHGHHGHPAPGGGRYVLTARGADAIGLLL